MPAKSGTTFTEFQGVVLAGGYGSRMTDISDEVPKPLLPVATVPLFWYALNTLRNNHIYDVLLITNDKCIQEIKGLLANEFPFPELHIDIVSPGVAGEEWGTVEVLRHFADRIRHDFIVFSGDIVSDLNLAPMLQFHRAEDSTLTVLLADNIVNADKNNLTPGTAGKNPKYRDFTIISANAGTNNRLLFMAPEEDFEEMKPKHQLFMKFPHVNLTSRYYNCHIYVMKRGLLNVIRSFDSSFISLTADFVPYILQQQFGKPDTHVNDMIFGHAEKKDEDLVDYATQEHKLAASDDPEEIRCFAFKTTADSGALIARCNTVAAWFEANRLVQTSPTLFFSADMINKLGISKKISGADARSAIDETAGIGAGVRVIGSVVMKGATIKNKCTIKDSIVCPNASIGEGCQVAMSIVGADEVVPENSRLTQTVQKCEGEMELDD